MNSWYFLVTVWIGKQIDSILFFFVIILQKMSNPDGDEDLNWAQTSMIHKYPRVY